MGCHPIKVSDPPCLQASSSTHLYPHRQRRPVLQEVLGWQEWVHPHLQQHSEQHLTQYSRITVYHMFLYTDIMLLQTWKHSNRAGSSNVECCVRQPPSRKRCHPQADTPANSLNVLLKLSTTGSAHGSSILPSGSCAHTSRVSRDNR